MTLPNLLTASRFFLALLIFTGLALINGTSSSGEENPSSEKSTLFPDMVLVLFLVASLTDVLDGHLARKRKLFSQFGRIADPMVDKIIICGCLIFLSGFPAIKPLLPSWIVAIIIVRELSVDSIRSFFESKNISFQSRFLGKLKMVFQCVTVSFSIVYLGHLYGSFIAEILLSILIWITLVLVLASAGDYFLQARRLFREPEKR